MKRSLTILLTLAIAVVLAVPAVADQAQAATDAAKGELSHANRTGEMQMYHIVLAEHGPNWKSQGSDEGMNVRMEVIDASNISRVTFLGTINLWKDGETAHGIPVRTRVIEFGCASVARPIRCPMRATGVEPARREGTGT